MLGHARIQQARDVGVLQPRQHPPLEQEALDVLGSGEAAVGTRFREGGQSMYFRYTVQVCDEEPPPPPPGAPTARISSPDDGPTFEEGEEITFSGSAQDAQGNPLTGGALVWTSSLDGQIGTDTSFTRSDLSPGAHVITLEATDDEGRTGTASVIIQVLGAPPPPPPPPLDPSTITAASFHSCGLTTAGNAYCWGGNTFGQLGDGTRTDRLTPVAVAGGLTFAVLSAGGWDTCGLTPDGEAYCWGSNRNGKLGDGTGSPRLVPTPVLGGLRFSTISVGDLHTCAITTDNQAYCWGGGSNGQLGDGTTTTSRPVPGPVSGGLRFTDIDAGWRHTCGVTQDNEAYCWGDNREGQLGDGTTTDRLLPTPVEGNLAFAQISAPSEGIFGVHTCGVTTDGAAYCWGFNSRGQLGDNTITRRLVPTAVAGGLVFDHVSTGNAITCGVTRDDVAYCWGQNTWGQLGDGTTTGRRVLTGVAGGLAFRVIATGGFHSCGLTSDGGAYCWGNNGDGRLGDGTTTQRLTPTPVAAWRDLAALPFIGSTFYALMNPPAPTCPAAPAAGWVGALRPGYGVRFSPPTI